MPGSDFHKVYKAVPHALYVRKEFSLRCTIFLLIIESNCCFQVTSSIFLQIPWRKKLKMYNSKLNIKLDIAQTPRQFQLQLTRFIISPYFPSTYVDQTYFAVYWTITFGWYQIKFVGLHRKHMLIMVFTLKVNTRKRWLC